MSYGLESYRHINKEGLFEYHLSEANKASTCQWIYFECGYNSIDEKRNIIYTVALAVLAFWVYDFTLYTISRAYLLESSLLFSTFYYIPLVIGALITIRFALQFWNNHNHYVQQQALANQRKLELS